MRQAMWIGSIALLALLLGSRVLAQDPTPVPAQEGSSEITTTLTNTITATENITSDTLITATESIRGETVVTSETGISPTADVIPGAVITGDVTAPVTPPVIPPVVIPTEVVSAETAITTTTQVTTTITTITETIAITATQAVTQVGLQATGLLDPLAPAFVTLNLQAGVALDPFVVSVNGGGLVDASTLGAGCAGYIAVAPTVAVNWLGGAEFVEAFFYSDFDPVLVIQTPSGDFLCNDDANDVLLDPVIEMQAPPTGLYRIWVGSFNLGQAVPGLLVLTTDPALTIGTFAPGELVQRDAIPEEVVEPGDVRTTLLPTVTATIADLGVPVVDPTGLPINAALVITGSTPAFDLPTGDAVCTGYIGREGGYLFRWEGVADTLRFYFEGDGDTSLVVVGPGERVACNDDATPGQNINPRVDIDNPQPGLYIVLVGRFDLATPVTGQLTVAAGDDGNAPALLAPPPAPPSPLSSPTIDPSADPTASPPAGQ